MTAREVSPNGYSDAYGPNVANILAHGSRVITSRIPAQVRAELRLAVKDRVLGHLPKDGLKPEVFFHPAHKGSAKELQVRHATADIEAIRKIIA